MNSILDSQRKPTTLKPGNCIYYNAENYCLKLGEKAGNGSVMYWANGDNKKIADFIRNEVEFFEFASVLAETHGLSLKRGPDCVHDACLVFA